jgi:hypothetical protein
MTWALYDLENKDDDEKGIAFVALAKAYNPRFWVHR